MNSPSHLRSILLLVRLVQVVQVVPEPSLETVVCCCFNQSKRCVLRLYSRELFKGGVSSAGGGSLGRWEDGDDLVAHFWRRAAFDQAAVKLGGGMRGRFRVRG